MAGAATTQKESIAQRITKSHWEPIVVSEDSHLQAEGLEGIHLCTTKFFEVLAMLRNLEQGDHDLRH
jgi:hypothetical protein